MPADTRKDEIEGLFSGHLEQVARAKKLICCWPPPGHVMEESQILDGRKEMAKRVFQSLQTVVNSLPQ